MSVPSWHFLHGLCIRSDIPLDPYGLAPAGLVADLVILRGADREIPSRAPQGTVIASAVRHDRPDQPFYTAVADDNGYLLRFHGCCEVRVLPRFDQAECHVQPGVDPALIAVFLSGITLAFFLGLRGHPILHAAAVSAPGLDGELVAVAGGPGSGKSTLTALLCAAGCNFVTDDLLRLDVHGRHTDAIGGCSELRLRPGAAHLLDAFDPVPPTTRVTVDGRLALLFPKRDPHSPRLRLVILPWPSRVSDQVRLERVEPSEALLLLARYPRLDGWTLPAVLSMQFDALSRLVGTTPVLVAQIPWDPAPTVTRAVELLRQLEEHRLIGSTSDTGEAPSSSWESPPSGMRPV